MRMSSSLTIQESMSGTSATNRWQISCQLFDTYQNVASVTLSSAFSTSNDDALVYSEPLAPSAGMITGAS